MGCRIRITRHKTIALRVYWNGRESQESTGLRATQRNLERAERLAKRIDALIRGGAFTEVEYRHFFPWGSRREVLGLPAKPDRRRSAGKLTVRDYAERWIEAEKPPTISEGAHAARKSAVRAWICHPDLGIGGVRMADVTAAVVADWQARLFAKGLSYGTVRQAITSKFRAMWTHATRTLRDEGLFLGDPLEGLKWPRQIREAPNPIPASEEKAIQKFFREEEPHYTLFMALLFGTGARPSELTGLTWSDFEPETGKLSIIRSRVRGRVGPTKTGASRRTIALAPELVEQLSAARPMLPDPLAPIFTNKQGSPVNEHAFSNRQWARCLKELRLGSKRLYTTRHTYISKALTEGANVKHIAEYVGTSVEKIQENYGRWMGRTDVDPLTAAQESKLGPLKVPGNESTVAPVKRRTHA